MSPKEKLFETYNNMKNKDIDCVTLFIHMPTGETESIVNPNVEEKMQYIDKTYDDNLVHTNCKEIYIEDYLFCEKNSGVTFGIALDCIRDGIGGMRLPSWKEDVVVRAQIPDKYSKMTAPYLYVESRFGRVPWKETFIEMFSTCWEVVE